jgi:hypothetical protein
MNLMNSFHDPVARANVVAEFPVADRPVLATVAKIRSTKAYVIQVALSVVAFDPSSVPHLDVFDSYHLYCDVSLENDFVHNALRLGFFTEAGSATALAGYLASYFDSPRVVQIDAAEEARSVHQKFVALKNVGDSGGHLDTELVAPRPLPTASQRPPSRVAPSHQTVVRSLWSRLVGLPG